MSVLEACIKTGVILSWTPPSTEDPTKVCEDPLLSMPTTSGNGKAAAPRKGVNAILGVGFDPGIVNAYCAWAVKHQFDTIRHDRHHGR